MYQLCLRPCIPNDNILQIILVFLSIECGRDNGFNTSYALHTSSIMTTPLYFGKIIKKTINNNIINSLHTF